MAQSLFDAMFLKAPATAAKAAPAAKAPEAKKPAGNVAERSDALVKGLENALAALVSQHAELARDAKVQSDEAVAAEADAKTKAQAAAAAADAAARAAAASKTAHDNSVIQTNEAVAAHAKVEQNQKAIEAFRAAIAGSPAPAPKAAGPVQAPKETAKPVQKAH